MKSKAIKSTSAGVTSITLIVISLLVILLSLVYLIVAVPKNRAWTYLIPFSSIISIELVVDSIVGVIVPW